MIDIEKAAREIRLLALLAWQTQAKLDGMERARLKWLRQYKVDQKAIQDEIDESHFVRKKKRGKNGNSMHAG